MPAIPRGVRGATITGWGSALPPKVLTNYDLEQMFETSHDWIVERTGIAQRHVGGTTTGLSIEAARQALDSSGADPASFDALILATTTPDRCVPASSPGIASELGIPVKLIGIGESLEDLRPFDAEQFARALLEE